MTSLSNNDLDKLALKTDARYGELVLNQVYNFLGRFICYPSEHAHVAHALWCVHAHMMDKWESTPRLAFLSPEPASGKSRALEITELLVPNPVAAVNVSPAYLFRKMGSEQGVTLLYDEIDTVFGPKARDNEEIRGLLNAGHRKGAVAGRCVVRGKAIETEEIPAYAAVAMAGLGWLPDTIKTRAVIIKMRRRHDGERVEQYRRRIHAKPLDDRRLASRLRAYSIKPKQLRVGTSTPRGYCRTDFEEQWRSYLPPLPQKTKTTETSKTMPENGASNGGPVLDVLDVLDLAGKGGDQVRTCDHCHKPGDLQQVYCSGEEAWLHRDCQKSWLAAQDDLGIPSHLDGALNS
jgi:hypothetical protein